MAYPHRHDYPATEQGSAAYMTDWIAEFKSSGDLDRKRHLDHMEREMVRRSGQSVFLDTNMEDPGELSELEDSE